MLKDSHLEGREILSTHYRYDKLNRLIQAHNAHSELRFGYDHNRLVKEQLIHLDEPLTSGFSRSQSKDVAAQITEHRYDVLGNRIQTILPTGEVLNRLYYGSGHLHHVNLDGTILADIERDALHRPVERTIGKLNTQFQLDPLGRLKQQIAQPNGHNKADPAVLIGRSYQYDTIGNLIRTDDQTNGNRDYTYDALGRITQCADEHYRYDPAHNLTDGSRVVGNRLTQYKGISYRYDPLGNLIEKQQNDGEIQHYRYNADNQLTEAEIHRPGQNAVLYRYRYDPIGRRIAKVHPDGSEIQYLWDGSRLLQEYRKGRTYTYVYTEDRNYEPLAQITTYNGSDKAREILYYHNDQIGIPREMTDGEGNIVWRGDYSGWGKLTQEERLKSDVYQPIRLQNQHYDEETGLHYNFFRYYDPEIGRFTQQDPIKLAGGYALYNYSLQPMKFIDPLGWIEWKGTAYSASAGVATGTRFELATECIKGKKGRATVYAVGSSYGRGGIVGVNGSNVTFEDKLDHIDPKVFNGVYSEGNANVTFIKGIGLGSTQLGQAESKGLFTIYDRGYSYGLAANGGKSTVTSSFIEPCTELPKVNCGKCQYPSNPIKNPPYVPSMTIDEAIGRIPHY